MNNEPNHIKIYNLPQRVEGGIKIHGSDDVIYLFDYLDGMYANCRVEGSDKIMHLHASTPLVELGNDEWKIEGEPEVHEDDKEPENANTPTT